MLFFTVSLKEFVFIIRVKDLGGKLVLLMKITSCENKWTVNASRKSCIPVFYFSWVLELDESCWVWIIFLSVSLCFAPYPGCEQC